MKKLLNMLSVLIISSTSIITIACKSKSDDKEISIQVITPTPGSVANTKKITEDAIAEVMKEVKDDKELSKYSFRTVDTSSTTIIQDKLAKDSLPNTDKTIPDIFFTHFDKIKDFADKGYLMPLDAEESGKEFLDYIGLSESTIDKDNNFTTDSLSRVNLKAKETKQKNVYAVPTSHTTASGFFFKKDPASLELYKSLGLGEIVRVAPDGTKTIIDKAPTDNYDDVTFDFANDNNGKNSALKYGYIPFNNLISASMKASANDSKTNLFQMGIATWWQIDFGAKQIAHKDHPNVKQKLAGSGWNRENTKYLKELSEAYQDLGYLNENQKLDEILKIPGSTYNWDTTLNHPGFKDSVDNYYGKLLDYAIMQGRYSHTKSFGQGVKGDEYFDRARGTDDVIMDTYQQLMLRGNSQDPIDTKMWMLNAHGPEYAAWKLGLLNLASEEKFEDFAKNNPEKLNDAYKNLDFAPIYTLGTGTGDLTDESSWNTDPSTARAWAQGWGSGIGGSAIAVNNRLRKDKNYANKAKLIRKYISKLVDKYMRRVEKDGAVRWYEEGLLVSPIKGVINKVDEAITKGTIKSDTLQTKYPNIRRLKLTHLSLAVKLAEDSVKYKKDKNKKLWIEPGIPITERNLNSDDAGKPFANAWTRLVTEDGLLKWGAKFENKDVWNDIIGLKLDEIKDPATYRKLRAELLKQFKTFIITKLGTS